MLGGKTWIFIFNFFPVQWSHFVRQCMLRDSEPMEPVRPPRLVVRHKLNDGAQ